MKEFWDEISKIHHKYRIMKEALARYAYFNTGIALAEQDEVKSLQNKYLNKGEKGC